jgi:hypothetical protein
MILLTHIIIALSSLAFTTYLYFKPSSGKFYISYGLIGATIVSGTYLVISTRAPLVSSCITGLIYLGVALGGIFAAYQKATKTT